MHNENLVHFYFAVDSEHAFLTLTLSQSLDFNVLCLSFVEVEFYDCLLPLDQSAPYQNLYYIVSFIASNY